MTNITYKTLDQPLKEKKKKKRKKKKKIIKKNVKLCKAIVMLLHKPAYYLPGTVVAESPSMCTSFTKCNSMYFLQTLFCFYLL